MTIPTKEKFEACRRKINDSIASQLQISLTRELVASNKEKSIRLIDEIISERANKASLVPADEAYLWLANQAAFSSVKRAFSVRSGAGNAQQSASQMAIKIFESLKEIADLDFSHGWERFRIRRSILFGTHRRSEIAWILRFFDALIEYYFTDSARRIVENRRRFRSKVAAAIAGMKALRELTSDQAIINRFNVLQGKSGPPIPLVDATYSRRLRILVRMQTTHIDSMYPIARLDDTVRERLFVFRIARANQLCFGKSKTSLVADLMGLEGFENQLDERTIERHCATAIQIKRQLFNELDETTDVSVV
ncbi:hypothetical protein SB783_05245 [Paraburkholderia sp. SIMBA_009]